MARLVPWSSDLSTFPMNTESCSRQSNVKGRPSEKETRSGKEKHGGAKQNTPNEPDDAEDGENKTTQPKRRDRTLSK